MQRESLNHYLQHAEPGQLQELRLQIQEQATVEIIQSPTAQTILLPIRDPINGGTFYGGEVLVTSAIVRVGDKSGWAMVMDDDGELALAVAICDGAYAGDICTARIQVLAESGKQVLAAHTKHENRCTNGTRVSFDLL